MGESIATVFILLLIIGSVWLFLPRIKNFKTLTKGWFGEKKTNFNLSYSISSKIYRRFNDIIIPSGYGTTQIDHLLVSPYGIFIIETKNRKGWIFGSKDQKSWMQSLYGNNYSFQNPLRQTFRQKKVISEFLDIKESSVHTVVYFVGDCEFKTQLPDNVINSSLGKYIKQFKNRLLSTEEIARICRKLESHLAESSLTTKDHVQSLRERHNSSTVCPKCGSKLVERTAKKGAHAGTKFLGCNNYPRCRFTKNLS